jgi:hypothetical protein
MRMHEKEKDEISCMSSNRHSDAYLAAFRRWGMVSRCEYCASVALSGIKEPAHHVKSGALITGINVHEGIFYQIY